MCHSFHTSKMTGTNQEQLIDHLRVLLFFIELNLFLYVVISTHRRQQNPAPAQPASLSPPPPRRRRKPQNPWVLPWILQREERGCYRTLLELITTDIPGYRHFTWMEPAFFLFDWRKNHPPPQEVNYQLQEATGGWVETGSYFETLIHRATPHSNTTRGWKNDHLQICPQVCKAILKEFQQEYLVCPTHPEDWMKIEERFKNRWNVPHAVGALDGHIAIKKPKRSDSEYFNYKDYFSLVLLVPPGGFSTCYVVPHMLTQCLSQLLASAPLVPNYHSLCRLQVPVGQNGGQWVIIWCTDFELQQTEKKYWKRNLGSTTTWTTCNWIWGARSTLLPAGGRCLCPDALDGQVLQ